MTRTCQAPTLTGADCSGETFGRALCSYHAKVAAGLFPGTASEHAWRDPLERVCRGCWSTIPPGAHNAQVYCSPECKRNHALALRADAEKTKASEARVYARKTHCPKGHPYDGDYRPCRTCKKAWNAATHAARRAAS